MPQSGSVIGGYRVENAEDIGKGGFGRVYRARALETGALVALKLVSLNNNEEAVAAERTGARLQQRFMRAHGMVPEVFDFGDDAHFDCFYIAMEFVAAPTLSALLHRRPFTPVEAARHAIGICRFLEKAHSFETEIDGERFPRIVHGDLKPANLLAGERGEVKLADFGLTGHAGARPALHGSPRYIAPERLRGAALDPRGDVFAAGAILVEILTGRPAFDGTPFDIMQQLLAGATRPRATGTPLERVARRALSREPALRFADAGEFLVAFGSSCQLP